MSYPPYSSGPGYQHGYGMPPQPYYAPQQRYGPPPQQYAPQVGVDLYNSPILIYDQPQSFFSTEANYTIWSPQGHPVAYVKERGVSGARKVFRAVNQGTQNKAERSLTIFRPDGMPYFTFYKPYGFMGTPVMQVLTPQGGLMGQLRKRALRGWEILDPQERQIGYYDIYKGQIRDWQEIELARFQRGFNGYGELVSQMLTGADRYVLRLHTQLAEPVRTLVLACPLAYDTAVSSNRSLGGFLT
jgi:hypothetical protein